MFFAGAFVVHSAVKNCDISNFPRGKKAAVCFFGENIYVRYALVRCAFGSVNFMQWVSESMIHFKKCS